jgi:hypothetical protein
MIAGNPGGRVEGGGTASTERLIIAFLIGSANRNLGYERAKASFSWRRASLQSGVNLEETTSSFVFNSTA